MRLLYIIAALFIMLINTAKSQNNYKLIGEVNGKRISLLWTIDKWNGNLDGVFIKRRNVQASGNRSEWTTLTKSMLIQSNELAKDLSNVSNNKRKVKQLVVKRQSLFQKTQNSTTTIVEQTKTQLSSELNKDKSVLSMLGLMFTYDYDIALMFGFGYEDYKLPKNGTLEYGLFSIVNGVESNDPVATYVCNVKDIPDLKLKVLKAKIKKHRKEISLRIQYDGKELDAKKTLAGFNIYRKTNSEEFKKLNKQVIWLSKAQVKRTLFYTDPIDNSDLKYTYAIVPVSIFYNEGENYELFWSKNTDVAIEPPTLYSKQNSNADFIAEGVVLNWNFNKEMEEKSNGFIVQRKMGSESEYKVVSDTLPVNQREYIDNNFSDKNEVNYNYRILLLVKDSYNIWSNTVRFYYNPKPLLDEVVKLNASSKINGDDIQVNLKWESPSGFIDKIRGFVLYCDRSGGILARESEYENIRNNEITYSIEGAVGKAYQFAVKYESNDGEISEYSDTIKIIIPNSFLPKVVIWPFRVLDKQISIDWKYADDFIDLKGFRIYINGELVASEDDVNSLQRTWTSDILEVGKYELRMEAVSMFGVVSNKSSVRIIVVK